MSPIQLRLGIAEIAPPIWRRLIVADRMTLHELHRAIQVVFDWYDCHLYEFQVDGRRFEAPHAEAEGADSSKVELSSLALTEGDSFIYRYDFGDDWTHVIEVEEANAVPSQDLFPWLLGGARRGPPEDSGGPHRYMELLRILDKVPDDRDDDERDLVEWIGPQFDPEDFSVDQARHALLLASAWGVLKRKQ